MIGRRPEPVPGEVPGRWRVVRARGLGEHWPNWSQSWYVERENCHGSMCFHTWREAQDYADRQARTREVVLPRITDDREEGITEWPNLRDLFVWPGQHDEPRLGQPYLRIADDYRDVDVELHDLRPLAGVLLAYAEQEGLE